MATKQVSDFPSLTTITGEDLLHVKTEAGLDNKLKTKDFIKSQGVLRNFDTLATMVAKVGELQIGQVVSITERTTGNGGGAKWKVVDATTVTENEFNIVAGDVTRSFELIVNGSVNVRAFGARGDGASDDTAAIDAAITYAIALPFLEKSIAWPAGNYYVDKVDLTSRDYVNFNALGTVQITGRDAAASDWVLGSSNYNVGTPTASTFTRNFTMTGGDWLIAPASGQPYKHAMSIEQFVLAKFNNVSCSGTYAPSSRVFNSGCATLYMMYSYVNEFNNCSFSADYDTITCYTVYMGNNNNNLNVFNTCRFAGQGSSVDIVGIKVTGNSNRLVNCDVSALSIGLDISGSRGGTFNIYTELCKFPVVTSSISGVAFGNTFTGGLYEVMTDGVCFSLGQGAGSQNTTITGLKAFGQAGGSNRTFIDYGTLAYIVAAFTNDLVDIDTDSTGTYNGHGGLPTAGSMPARWITFPATQEASPEPNTLDDYKETSSFTPTANIITFASASGWSTKVGNLMTVGFIATWPVTADASNAQIKGLPVACSAAGSEKNGLAVGYTGGGVIGGSIASGTTIALRDSSGANVINSALSGLTVSGTISYMTD